MTKYTFTFSHDTENAFKKILGRLEPDEYEIIEDIHPVDVENPKYSDKSTIIEMDSECALTFRMGMKEVKIRRERTEEELAEEKAISDRHTVKVVIKVPPSDESNSQETGEK